MVSNAQGSYCCLRTFSKFITQSFHLNSGEEVDFNWEARVVEPYEMLRNGYRCTCISLKKILFIPAATIPVSVTTKSPYTYEHPKTAEGNDYESSLVILLYIVLIIYAVENTVSCRLLAYSRPVQTQQMEI